MVSLITILSLLKGAAKITKKLAPNADLDMFIHELDSALHSPAGLKLRANSIKEKLNGVMDKLSPAEQQTFQDNIAQSFSSNGLSTPFDENGNLNVHFSDFLSQCDASEAIDLGGLSESVSDVTDSSNDIVDGVTDMAENADSIWDFLSDLFG